MRRLIRNGLLLMLSLAATVAGCGPRGGGPGPDIERALARGRAAAAAWIEEGRTTAGAAEATIALGYLERLRLGLGSPFRLIDFALHDPRLDAATRRRLGWALLARTLDGDAYRIDAAALDRVGVAGVAGRAGVGRYHLELIEGAVSEARDPHGGELAVRLAYALTAAEGGVSREAVPLAAQAAALILDRALARADASRLIRAAAATGGDPLRLLPAWRAERRFQVEQPSLAPLPIDVEREAMQVAPRLAMAINALSPRLGGGTPAAAAPTAVPLPGAAAARHLAALADSLDAPPQTAIAIAVDVHRYELLDRPGLADAERRALGRFAQWARNEERFAAEYALLATRETRPVPGTLARIALMAAVGLRPFAQEPVWFPGFGGPSTRELEDRFGLAFVRFDRDVPAAWRPFYRRVLVEALADLQRVLPALDLRGLGIHFGESRGKAATLAIHDPRRRTIYLPPATGAGTIAHEVAHDLDWQVALRRYRVRGDYGSDRATRGGRDRLAISVRRLSTARLLPPMPGDPAPVAHDRRPAEVFARSIDWFVAASLAQNGRINGYLSSVQDELLTGYGTVTPPDITGEAGQALVSILDEVAPLYPETREWFLRSYGPDRAPTAYDLVRRIVEADLSAGRESSHAAWHDEPAPALASAELSVMSSAAERFDALAVARDAAFAAIDAWVCATPGAAYDTRVEIARRRLVARATTARGRGLALRVAERIAGDEGRAWLARKLFGAPWPAAEVDSATANLLARLVDRLEALNEPRHDRTLAAPFQITAEPRDCPVMPLLSRR